MPGRIRACPGMSPNFVRPLAAAFYQIAPRGAMRAGWRPKFARIQNSQKKLYRTSVQATS